MPLPLTQARIPTSISIYISPFSFAMRKEAIGEMVKGILIGPYPGKKKKILSVQMLKREWDRKKLERRPLFSKDGGYFPVRPYDIALTNGSLKLTLEGLSLYEADFPARLGEQVSLGKEDISLEAEERLQSLETQEAQYVRPFRELSPRQQIQEARRRAASRLQREEVAAAISKKGLVDLFQGQIPFNIEELRYSPSGTVKSYLYIGCYVTDNNIEFNIKTVDLLIPQIVHVSVTAFSEGEATPVTLRGLFAGF